MSFLKHKKNRAFSSVEILLSLSILALISVSLVGLLFYSQTSLRAENLSNQALFLSRETMSAVSSIRNRSFADLVDGNHGLSFVAGEWFFSGTSDNLDPFTRSIKIESISVNEKKVSVFISFDKTPSRSSQIVIYKYFTNW